MINHHRKFTGIGIFTFRWWKCVCVSNSAEHLCITEAVPVHCRKCKHAELSDCDSPVTLETNTVTILGHRLPDFFSAYAVCAQPLACSSSPHTLLTKMGLCCIYCFITCFLRQWSPPFCGSKCFCATPNQYCGFPNSAYSISSSLSKLPPIVCFCIHII